MDDGGNEGMQQLQPLLHTEEINSTSVWPIIHLIRAVRFTQSSVVFPHLTRAPGCYGNPLITIPSVRLVERNLFFRPSAFHRYHSFVPNVSITPPERRTDTPLSYEAVRAGCLVFASCYLIVRAVNRPRPHLHPRPPPRREIQRHPTARQQIRRVLLLDQPRPLL